jgi:hypothetical protein
MPIPPSPCPFSRSLASQIVCALLDLFTRHWMNFFFLDDVPDSHLQLHHIPKGTYDN